MGLLDAWDVQTQLKAVQKNLKTPLFPPGFEVEMEDDEDQFDMGGDWYGDTDGDDMFAYVNMDSDGEEVRKAVVDGFAQGPPTQKKLILLPHNSWLWQD